MPRGQRSRTASGGNAGDGEPGGSGRGTRAEMRAEKDTKPLKVQDRGVMKEAKLCVVCNRPFTWRKKWERSWAQVTCCSKSCNAQRRQQLREAGASAAELGADSEDEQHSDSAPDDDDGELGSLDGDVAAAATRARRRHKQRQRREQRQQQRSAMDEDDGDPDADEDPS